MTKHVAYLINQYPKVSHTFIRTEILALERLGVSVERIAMRGWDAETVDPLDAEERAKTRYVLRGGALPLVGAAVAVALSRPIRLLAALSAALTFARGGERGVLIHLIYLAEACLLTRWLARDKDVSHIHAHFGSNAATVANLVSKLGGATYSLTIHGSEEFDKPIQWKIGKKVDKASFTATISSFCRSQVYRWASVRSWPRIEIVHCALDPRIVETSPIAPPDTKTLVCVGRLCEQKGQLLLLEALARLHARGVAAHLVLAGDGEMRSEIERAIGRQGLEPFVTITGWLEADAVCQHLDLADAMILPSFAEGLPVVIMEAMARSRPVISTYVGGIPELVRPGTDGLLVPAGDVEALTDAMKTLLTMSVAERTRMGQAARERVLERHSDRTEAGKLVRLFAHL